jgi:hypothetical protein
MLVRRELEKAWDLSPGVRDGLVKIFGPSYEYSFDNYFMRGRVAGTFVHPPEDLELRWNRGSRGPRDGTLADAIDAHRVIAYPAANDRAARRAFQVRVQRALHDGNAVVVNWSVFFEQRVAGAFEGVPDGPIKPPSQHSSIIVDYEAQNVAGFGTLAAGQDAEARARTAALAANARVVFFRIKNSWGTWQRDGYHDLHLDYLDGPIRGCEGNDCNDYTPLRSVLLPDEY